MTTIDIFGTSCSSASATVRIGDPGNENKLPPSLQTTGGQMSVLRQSPGISSWSDAQLIAAIRGDPPDEDALDVLVARHWNHLFVRCHMLTLNREKALDLAQAAWCKLLRARQALKPEGNFPAYLNTIATNLFRDSYRAARRAGPMAEYRLESLDHAYSNESGEIVVLVDNVPDFKSLEQEEQTLLAIDIDRALEQLTPQLREVLVARFIDGESCAEIGRRYDRTEQSISGWIRVALRQMKIHLEEPDGVSALKRINPKREPNVSRSSFPPRPLPRKAVNSQPGLPSRLG
jgi:RNA polymerase sigma factor (sigma-70 family)